MIGAAELRKRFTRLDREVSLAERSRELHGAAAVDENESETATAPSGVGRFAIRNDKAHRVRRPACYTTQYSKSSVQRKQRCPDSPLLKIGTARINQMIRWPFLADA